jgi:hypothetical protein
MRGNHIWPQGTSMLIGFPNRNGTFSCMLYAPSSVMLHRDRRRAPVPGSLAWSGTNELAEIDLFRFLQDAGARADYFPLSIYARFGSARECGVKIMVAKLGNLASFGNGRGAWRLDADEYGSGRRA